MFTSVRSLTRRASSGVAKTMLIALAFLGGGLVLPHVVDATVSSGEKGAFIPVAPARILDSRFGPSPLPVGQKLGPNASIDVQVAGQGGVSAAASAVVLNITVTSASAQSHLTVWPTGQAKPNSSNLNFVAGDTVPNAVTVKVGAGGKVSIFNNAGDVHVIADVNGYYEDHNHDDRYDTKAQVDTKINNAQSENNYVGSNQIVDGSVANADVGANAVTGAKVQDHSLSGADVETGVVQRTFNVPSNISIASGSCAAVLDVAGSLPANALVAPVQVSTTAGTTVGAIVADTYVSRNGGFLLRMCNSAATTKTLGAGDYTFDFHFIQF